MKKISFLSIVFWASFCMLFVSLAGPMTRISNAKTSGPPIFAGEVVIQGSPASVPAGYKIKKVLPHANLVVVEVEAGKESDHVQSLRGKGHKASLNLKYQASQEQPVNDPLYFLQWHLPKIQCREAWEVSTGSDVTVAVLDSGLRPGGPDGIGCVVADTGIDIVNGDSFPYDDAGHGTHVSGTIAQTTNNIIGVAGVAYDACIMAVKVLDASGSGSSADIAAGINHAVTNGAQVINMSLGINARARITSDPFMDAALDNAYDNDVTVVCAAGNDSWRKNVSYPAIYPTTIAVGATDYNNNKAYYSNYGTGLDIMAPGGDVRVDLNGDGYLDGVLQETFDTDESWKYFYYQGTSMACPHVTGVIALLLERDADLTPDAVRAALNDTALDLGVVSTYGHGLVQAYAALSSIEEGGCADDDDCDDENLCTDDACLNGACEYTNNISGCDDGDACTEYDTCSGGVCVGTALDCNDNEPCTIDSCVEGICINEPIICNDNNPCTDDACVNGACVYTNNTSGCDDGDACTTNDTCVDGVCAGTEPVCGPTDGCCPEGCDSASDPDCQPQEVCGDGYCAGSALGEDCNSCPQDCSDFKGECCGNGNCERFEGKRGNCPVDCQ